METANLFQGVKALDTFEELFEETTVDEISDEELADSVAEKQATNPYYPQRTLAEERKVRARIASGQAPNGKKKKAKKQTWQDKDATLLAFLAVVQVASVEQISAFLKVQNIKKETQGLRNFNPYSFSKATGQVRINRLLKWGLAQAHHWKKPEGASKQGKMAIYTLTHKGVRRAHKLGLIRSGEGAPFKNEHGPRFLSSRIHQLTFTQVMVTEMQAGRVNFEEIYSEKFIQSCWRGTYFNDRELAYVTQMRKLAKVLETHGKETFESKKALMLENYPLICSSGAFKIISGADGRPKPKTFHDPDGFITRSMDAWAIEVEISEKDSRSLQSILETFRLTDGLFYSGILYYTNNPLIAKRVKAAAAVVDLGKKMPLIIKPIVSLKDPKKLADVDNFIY